MSESISAEDGRRAPRVKLAGLVLALIQLENGRQIRSRLHQLSITGGLLYLDDPLDEGIKVQCAAKRPCCFLCGPRRGASSHLSSLILQKMIAAPWSPIWGPF